MPQDMTPPPLFTAGQIMSAGAHLNALTEAGETLKDDYLGNQEPFCGLYPEFGDGMFLWTQHWEGAIRHKTNTFKWICGANPGSIKIGGKTVPGSNVASGTADISSLGLTVNSFYAVDIENAVRVDYLAELQTVALPTLIDFHEEVTPTAAQWQALSNYASALDTILSHPHVPVLRTPRIQYDGYFFNGTINHRCRYLLYEISLYSGMAAHIEINGSEVFTVTTTHSYGRKSYSGEIDLTSVAPGIALGQDYRVSIYSETSGSHVDARLYWLLETPEAAAYLGSWEPMDEWAHGDYVHGNAVAKQVDTIKNNLGYLGAVAQYHNYPCISQRAGWDWRFNMRRRWRWLHYKTNMEVLTEEEIDHGETAKPEQAEIGYVFKGELKQYKLPHTGIDEWQVYDLDSAQGLYPGMAYLLATVKYAIEDVVP